MEDIINYNNITLKFFHTINDTSGIGCIEEIITNDEYKLYKYRDIKGNIIDIGGNHGLVTIILALQNPLAHIYVLEPIPDLVEIININIKLNNIKNVTVINKALGNNENVDLFISNQYSGASSTIVENIDMFSNQYNGYSKINIETISLDNLLKKYNIDDVEVLKIDCEGGEYFLYDSELFKKKCVKNIIGEFHNLKYNKNNNNWNTDALTEYIKIYIDGDINISYLDL